jgi:hypothetical protein
MQNFAKDKDHSTYLMTYQWMQLAVKPNLGAFIGKISMLAWNSKSSLT